MNQSQNPVNRVISESLFYFNLSCCFCLPRYFLLLKLCKVTRMGLHKSKFTQIVRPSGESEMRNISKTYRVLAFFVQTPNEMCSLWVNFEINAFHTCFLCVSRIKQHIRVIYIQNMLFDCKMSEL